MSDKYKGKRVLVVGLGKSGVAAANFLAEQGANVTVTDLKSKNELNNEIKALGAHKVEYDLGKHNSKTFLNQDYIIVSPGVPSETEALVEARNQNIPIINEIELAYPLMKAPIIAVTGTNGKTTTTTLISEMLKADGKNVALGGNIGTPVLEMVQQNPNADVYVLELSSFQLESINKFKPNVAVMTNLEPNHLDRYPAGIDAYYGAKKRLLLNADSKTTFVTNLDNEHTSRLGTDFPGKAFGKILTFTKRNPIKVNPAASETFSGAYLTGSRVTVKIDGQEEIFDLLLSKLVGEHNRENLMAAILASKSVGCSAKGIKFTIETFRGVTHRLEYIRKKDGVSFYNDSKCTSVPALMRALNAFQAPIILISGGRDKDQDFTPLADLVKRKVKNLILIGEAKEKVNRSIGDFSETFLVGTFEEAVLIAYQKSRNGDVILLSPACASYDMFKNYEERGEYFKKIVAQL